MSEPLSVEELTRLKEHRCEWGNFGWACSCGASREWPLAPVGRARAAAMRHQAAANKGK